MTDPRAESMLLRHVVFDTVAEKDFALRRAAAICRWWADRGCPRSRFLTNFLGSYEDLCHGLEGVKPLRRLEFPDGIPNCPENSLRHITTSGSSGVPLTYSISQPWRTIHHRVWQLAYQHMSSGQISDYLSDDLIWAMARVPGGSTDKLKNLIECVPGPDGVQIYGSGQRSPDVIHGSSTTMIEILENAVARSWKPSFVIFTYEKPLSIHIDIIKDAWPFAQLHYEYASNDGGSSAFSCSQGNMHFWTPRALPRYTAGALRVIDLWNDATAFVAYESGDDVTWIHDTCPCGLALPLININGRLAGSITLDNGRRVPNICPFTSEQMRGLKGVRVLAQAGNVASVKYITASSALIDFNALERCLIELGFDKVVFLQAKQLSELRQPIGKYRTIVQDPEWQR